MCVLSLTVKTCTSESELELLCDSESESLVSMILTRVQGVDSTWKAKSFNRR